MSDGIELVVFDHRTGFYTMIGNVYEMVKPAIRESFFVSANDEAL